MGLYVVALVFGIAISLALYFIWLWPRREPPEEPDDEPDQG
jgi:hypothetical protein